MSEREDVRRDRAEARRPGRRQVGLPREEIEAGDRAVAAVAAFSGRHRARGRA